MNHAQTEVLFKYIEVTIAMKEAVTVGQAEGCYQAVDGLADGEPASTEGAIILGGGYSEICSNGWEDFELRESSLDMFELGVFTNALEDFAEDEVGQA